MSPPDIHGEFLPVSFWPEKNAIEWRARLKSALFSAEPERDQVVNAIIEGAGFTADAIGLDTTTLIEQIDRAVKDAQVDGLAHAMAERGWLPLYGMPTRVRDLYLQLRHLKESNRREWSKVDRDLDLAIYEFAPGSSVVIDKKEHLCVGLTPELSDPAQAAAPHLPGAQGRGQRRADE